MQWVLGWSLRCTICLVNVADDVGEVEVRVLLSTAQVRRGAGLMATVRRVGRELSRRLYTLMTSTDPQLVIR